MILLAYICVLAFIALVFCVVVIVGLLHAEFVAYRQDIEKCLLANRGRNTRQSNP